MSGKDGQIFDIVTVTVLSFIGSVYFYTHKENRYSAALCRRIDYDPRKVSKFLGRALGGISLSSVPSLLAVILEKPWLTVFTVMIFAAVIIIGHKEESQGKLK